MTVPLRGWRKRGDGRAPAPGGGAVEPPARPRAGPPGSVLQWVRAQPALAAAVVAFCLVALVGLALSVPSGLVPADRRGPADEADQPPASAPANSTPADTVSRESAPQEPAAPAAPPAGREPAAPGPWLVQSAASRSPRGLALVYAYRALPPGGDSRFEWYVRLEGARSLLEGVEMVRWTMDPPPKGGDDLISRNRAGDGFPLLGDGPGGWFGVTATVRYKDGKTETLSRRIELPEPDQAGTG